MKAARLVEQSVDSYLKHTYLGVTLFYLLLNKHARIVLLISLVLTNFC